MSSINITFIIGIILALIGIRAGYKIGLTKGISHLVALIATLLTLMLILMLTASIHAGQSRNSIITIIILVILGTVYGVVKFLLKSAHKVSELPLLHQLDKIAGILIGLMWIGMLYMVIIALSYRGFLGPFGTMVAEDVKNSEILTLINSYNIMMPK
ncbi:MAG: hypothetical protein K5868_01890 [Lachnospiraceae bacterium]|nr:hypothetical protein [Lachnospiraceae bacterium]